MNAQAQPIRAHPNPILEISATHRSLAKLLGFKRMREVIFGYKFEVVVRFKNIRDQKFTGGDATINIHWPNGIDIRFNQHIPPLEPGQSHPFQTYTADAVTEGFALFFVHSARPYTGENLDFVNEKGDPRGVGNAFYSVLAHRRETFYTMWALYVTAFGFLIVALEKLYWLLKVILN